VDRGLFKRATIDYDICALLGYYTALSGSSVPTFRDNLSGPIFNGQEVLVFLTLKDGTDRLSRNVGKNYHLTLCNIAEERRSHLHRGEKPEITRTIDYSHGIFNGVIKAFTGQAEVRRKMLS
jgi:hypothetical protein